MYYSFGLIYNYAYLDLLLFLAPYIFSSHHKHVSITIIGIGNGGFKRKMEEMAGDHGEVLKVKDFDT